MQVLREMVFLGSRFFSIWRPLKIVRRDPIAVASCTSYPTSDYAPVDLVQSSGCLIPSRLSKMIDPAHSDVNHVESIRGMDKHRHLSGSYLSYAPSEGKPHGWHFISNQEPEDVLFIQLFDNQMEAHKALYEDENGDGSPGYPVRGAIHIAFKLEGQDWDGEAHESLEVRVFTFR
ncbi:GA4 desaturase [Penicillium sp. IBT 31633x]|nr:GA4 desaturase [Penicillium sp. IBT 31633x]